MATLGLDYATLRAGNPGLIYASISGYGQTGPDAHKGGFDLVAQGVTGIMSITGEPGSPPVKCGVPMTDLGAGLFALVGILAALVHRSKTGEGQHVDTSLVEAGMALSVWEATEYLSGRGMPRADRVRPSHDGAVSGDSLLGRLHHAWRRDRSPLRASLRCARPPRVGATARVCRRRRNAWPQPRGACRADRGRDARRHRAGTGWSCSRPTRFPCGPINDYDSVIRRSADPRARDGRRNGSPDARPAADARLADEDVSDADRSRRGARRSSASTRGTYCSNPGTPTRRSMRF